MMRRTVCMFLSGFSIFMKECATRPDFKGLGVPERGIKMGQLWRELSEENRKVYVEQAAQETASRRAAADDAAAAAAPAATTAAPPAAADAAAAADTAGDASTSCEVDIEDIDIVDCDDPDEVIVEEETITDEGGEDGTTPAAAAAAEEEVAGKKKTRRIAKKKADVVLGNVSLRALVPKGKVSTKSAKVKKSKPTSAKNAKVKKGNSTGAKKVNVKKERIKKVITKISKKKGKK